MRRVKRKIARTTFQKGIALERRKSKPKSTVSGTRVSAVTISRAISWRIRNALQDEMINAESL